MPTSKLDHVYRKMVLTKYFTKGWGDPDHLTKLFSFRKLVSNRDTCYELVSKTHPIKIIKQETRKGYKILEGKFISPFALHLPEIVPKEAHQACFQMVLPLTWKEQKPVCIHLAGTGDHNYWRRRNIMAIPLIKDGIASIILENAFYGFRKPKNQIRSSLHNVSDIFVMGGCCILECLALLHWCENQGFGPLGISGISMGGYMASLAATNWPKPVVLVPCLSWTTASVVFINGVMSESIDWDLLQEQYMGSSLFYEKLANIVHIIDNGFLEAEAYAPEKYKRPRKFGKNFSFPMTYILPRHYNTRAKYFERHHRKPRDAVHFMCGAMDECTHMSNYSRPLDTRLITAVCARLDGYVPRRGCTTLEDMWPGATIHYLNAGHISAFILHHNFFRKCIIETFKKAKDLYES